MENQLQLISQCLAGDRKALEQLLGQVQGLVYNLAVRFYWNPADAEDATQEILVKIITHLATFNGQSAFETWVYRVASNYLLNAKRGQAELLTFEVGADHLREGLQHGDYAAADRDLLAEEVKIGCTTSMLSCLSRPFRLAYIVGDILGFDGVAGATILAIEPPAFRKRLSLARQDIRQFMQAHCGIYAPENACRCSRQIKYDLRIDRIKPGHLLFADKGVINGMVQELEALGNDIAIFRSHPTYAAPDTLLDRIKTLFASGECLILTH